MKFSIATDRNSSDLLGPFEGHDGLLQAKAELQRLETVDYLRLRFAPVGMTMPMLTNLARGLYKAHKHITYITSCEFEPMYVNRKLTSVQSAESTFTTPYIKVINSPAGITIDIELVNGVTINHPQAANVVRRIVAFSIWCFSMETRFSSSKLFKWETFDTITKKLTSAIGSRNQSTMTVED